MFVTPSVGIATVDLTISGPLTHEESMNWVFSTIFLNKLREGAQITIIICCCILEPERIVELELELALQSVSHASQHLRGGRVIARADSKMVCKEDS